MNALTRAMFHAMNLKVIGHLHMTDAAVGEGVSDMTHGTTLRTVHLLT